MRILPLILMITLLIAIATCRKDQPHILPEQGEIPVGNLLSEPIRIEMDPYGLTPLAGRAHILTKQKTRVKAHIPGEYPVSVVSGDPAFEHEIMLLGLYPGQQNTIIFKVSEPESERFGYDTLLVEAPSLPAPLPAISIIEKRETQMEPGWNLIEMGLGPGQFFPLIFDPAGQARWYMKIDFIEGGAGSFERLKNGNWLWAKGQLIYEYDMLGREANRWEIPGYFQHHDQIEKPGGNLIVCVTKEGLDTGLDHIIELDRQTGGVVREWDLRQVLDMGRFDLLEHTYDWLHVNAVWFDEADEGLILSARHQGIFKVSRDNRLEWILAPHQGWGAAGPQGEGENTAPRLLMAVDGAGLPYSEEVQMGIEDVPGFSWPWGQHACMIVPGGNIFCFDNGWKKNFGDNAGYIRAVEYRLNPGLMELEQVWEYGKDRGSELYSHNVCDVDYLPATGNRLLCSGNISGPNGKEGRIIEVNYPGGEVVFEALIRYKNSPTPDIIYRAERLPLYPD